MNREETFDVVCTVLEEYAGETIEHIADQLLAVLSMMGDDVLDHLDPPVGLKRWLEAHGLSLIVTHSPTPPQVWGLLQGEDEEDEDDLQEGLGGSETLLEVGEYVEYRTAPSGPRGQSQIGSGQVLSVAVNGYVSVFTGPGQPVVWVDPRVDFIRIVDAPSPGQSAQAPLG